jgi:hypothetical protein
MPDITVNEATHCEAKPRFAGAEAWKTRVKSIADKNLFSQLR